jgi:hypothetical protein
MNLNQAAERRHIQCVRIVSDLPILVQHRSAKITRSKKGKTTKLFLSTVTIIVRESRDGVVTVEFKPP